MLLALFVFLIVLLVILLFLWGVITVGAYIDRTIERSYRFEMNQIKSEEGDVWGYLESANHRRKKIQRKYRGLRTRYDALKACERGLVLIQRDHIEELQRKNDTQAETIRELLEDAGYGKTRAE